MSGTVCFLTGVGVGAVLAVLYAPMSGAETQAFLRQKGKDGADHAKRAANEGADYVKRQAEGAKKTVTETAGRVKSAVVDPVAAAIDVGKQAYDERDAQS
jgi:gas vesicle protein